MSIGERQQGITHNGQALPPLHLNGGNAVLAAVLFQPFVRH
jgi:hypothetical protein